MHLSEECFKPQSWRNHNLAHSSGSGGSCAFGQGDPAYHLDRWRTELARLVAAYKESDDEGGKPLAELVADDWDIFDLPDEDASKALANAVPNLATKIRSSTWVPRSYGPAGDHVARWHKFIREIQKVNRYHPRYAPEESIFWDAMDSCARTINVGDPWLRARTTTIDSLLTPKKMGPPPPEFAHVGRANPAGIAYLYLGDSKETCLAEIRASKHKVVALGEFHPQQELTVVDLAQLEPPDFLNDSALTAVRTYRFLRELSSALQKPNTGAPHDLTYTPTQYLCELIKQGPESGPAYDGVLYPSCMHDGGKNLVLFNDQKVRCEDVQHVRVAHVTFTTERTVA